MNKIKILPLAMILLSLLLAIGIIGVSAQYYNYYPSPTPTPFTQTNSSLSPSPTPTPTPGPSLTFAATPTSISQGDPVSLNWRSTSATYCSALSTPSSLNFTGRVNATGQIIDYPSATTIYTITCGTFSRNATVSIVPLYLAGDVDGDSDVDINDMREVFQTQPQIRPQFHAAENPQDLCNPAADANGNGRVELSDGFYLLNYLFGEGPIPVRAPSNFSC